MGTNGTEPLTNLSVRKSNDFISAKYKSSLLENQVMAIALTRIEVNNNDKDSPLEARLYPGEIKKLVSDPAHIYRDLKKLAKTITGHTMFLEDGKGNFKAFAVVPNADYIDGVFVIKFNNELRDHVLGLEKNYTTLELSVMTDFKKNASFRLYEVLKKEAYKIPNGKDNYTQIEYNISELRFIIGLANSDDQSVKNAMASMKSIDWDELYEKLDKKDKKYEEWRDFQRRILIPAKEELEEKSDIRFEYEPVKEGRKTKRILFTIYRNIPRNPEIIDERQALFEATTKPNRQLEMPYDLYVELYEEYVGHNQLSKEDIDLLFKKAGGDAEKVKSAISLADKQPSIDNYMGWLIRCIENDYAQTEVIDGSFEDAKSVKQVMNTYEALKEAGIPQAKAWARIKNKEDYDDFIEYVILNGISEEQLEVIYSPEELVKMYTDYKMGREVSF